MDVSIDVGIKNFAIALAEESSFKYINNIDLSPYCCENLINTLNKILDGFIIKNILVEKQLPKNPQIVKISHHVEMYFKIKYPDCNYVYCDSRHKPIKSHGYLNRKKESIIYAMCYLKKEGQENVIKEIEKHNKKDDICDAICQYIHFKKLNI